MDNSIYVAIVIFGGLLDEIKTFSEYKNAYDFIVGVLANYKIHIVSTDHSINIDDFRDHFDELEGTKYEGTAIYECEVE